MEIVLHISDLHFGCADDRVVRALQEDVGRINPTLLVISGDLTQRARRSQFHLAREFLQDIPVPTVVVPGNHDIPLFPLAGRFLWPLKSYRLYITRNLSPVFSNGNITVLGINTTWPLKWKNGRVTHRHIEQICSTFSKVNSSQLRILVAHHPFMHPVPGASGHPNSRSSRRIFDQLESCGVDMLLAGHLHITTLDRDITCFPTERRSILLVPAGTATSRRRRTGPNAYKIIQIASPTRVGITTRAWNGYVFSSQLTSRYAKVADRWELVSCGLDDPSD